MRLRPLTDSWLVAFLLGNPVGRVIIALTLWAGILLLAFKAFA